MVTTVSTVINGELHYYEVSDEVAGRWEREAARRVKEAKRLAAEREVELRYKVELLLANPKNDHPARIADKIGRLVRRNT